MVSVGNYRGISLVSHIGKLFTSTINTRLMKWSEDNSVLTDAQFGFRPGYDTHDAIFALHSIISKSLRQTYTNGDNDSPCINPILQLTKSEKLPSCFTLDFNLEYIDLIRFKSFPVIPYLEIEVILNQKKNGILMGNPLKYVMNLCNLVFCY
jgi:hypothetical protein